MDPLPRSDSVTQFPLLEDGVSGQILQAILDAVLLVDLGGRIEIANAAALRLLGYRRSELEGKPLTTIFVDGESAIATTQLRRVRSGSELRASEAHLRTKSGEIIPVAINGAAVTDAGGVGRGIVLVARDLREVQELSQRAENERQLGALRRDLIAHAITAQEEERRRIARELHDESGQSLTSLLAGLERLEKSLAMPEARSQVRDLKRVAERVHVELGRISRGLRPSVLDDVGLKPAIERLIGEFRAMHRIPVQLVVSGCGARLPTAVETTLYRCIQEALTNVAKHASASRIAVTMQRLDDHAVVVVEDDGLGFDNQNRDGGGLGLASLRERAELLGGSLAIESEPGVGSTVYIRVPISTEAG